MLLQTILWGRPQRAFPWVYAGCIRPEALQAGSQPEQPHHYQHLLHSVRCAGRGEFTGLHWKAFPICPHMGCNTVWAPFTYALFEWCLWLYAFGPYDKRHCVVFRCSEWKNADTVDLLVAAAGKWHKEKSRLWSQVMSKISSNIWTCFYKLVRIAMSKTEGELSKVWC